MAFSPRRATPRSRADRVRASRGKLAPTILARARDRAAVCRAVWLTGPGGVGRRLLVLVLSAAAAACGSPGSDGSGAHPGPDPGRGSQPVDRVLFGTEYVLSVGGAVYARVHADSMYLYEDSSSARLFGVRLVLQDTLGARVAELGAATGRYDLRSQRMVATGKVVVERADGARFETNELHVDPESHRIWSDVATRLRHPDGRTTDFPSFTVDDRFRDPRRGSPET